MGTPHFAYIHVYTLSMYLHGSLRYGAYISIVLLLVYVGSASHSV